MYQKLSTIEIFPISWGGQDKGGTGQRVLRYIFEAKSFNFNKAESSKLIKIIIDSKWVDWLSEGESGISDPCFEKLADANRSFTTDKQIVIPLSNNK